MFSFWKQVNEVNALFSNLNADLNGESVLRLHDVAANKYHWIPQTHTQTHFACWLGMKEFKKKRYRHLFNQTQFQSTSPYFLLPFVQDMDQINWDSINTFEHFKNHTNTQNMNLIIQILKLTWNLFIIIINLLTGRMLCWIVIGCDYELKLTFSCLLKHFAVCQEFIRNW